MDSLLYAEFYEMAFEKALRVRGCLPNTNRESNLVKRHDKDRRWTRRKENNEKIREKSFYFQRYCNGTVMQ